MDHYQDLKILDDPEFPPTMLMNALFAKLHRVLVRMESKSIGISFPLVGSDSKSLGNILRLHGAVKALQQLDSQNWLKGMRDHLDISDRKLVPIDTKHCRVQRVQTKSSVERLRRRYLKRHEGVTDKDVLSIMPDSIEKYTPLPFLQMKSESTGRKFRLFIKQSTIQEESTQGEFNSYGLSGNATVPWF